jgi:hypothetical protein
MLRESVEQLRSRLVKLRDDVDDVLHELVGTRKAPTLPHHRPRPQRRPSCRRTSCPGASGDAAVISGLAGSRGPRRSHRGPTPDHHLPRGPKKRMRFVMYDCMSNEDTGSLAAPGMRQTLTGVDFCGSPLSSGAPTAAPRWSGSTGADDASGPAGGMFSEIVALAVTGRSPELLLLIHAAPQLQLPAQRWRGLSLTWTDVSHFLHRRLIRYEIPWICTIQTTSSS